METIDFACPVCEQKEYSKIKEFSDGVVVGKCGTCNLTYTPKRHNAPDDLFGEIPMEHLNVLYAPVVQNRRNHFRTKIFNKYLDKIKKYASGKKHLDIGCAHGFFINISRKAGYEVTGIEPNKTMAEFGKNAMDLNIHNGTLDQIDLKDEKWDAISFTDSLEYFMNPVGDLKKLVEHNLNKNGVIFIKVPNGDYFKFRHNLKTKLGFGLGAAEAYSPSKRVAHYNYKTIQLLAEKLGLETVKTGFFLPINSPDWFKYSGVHLEIESPWWMGTKNKIVRKVIHFFGILEFGIFRKNHLSQAVYIVMRKNN